MSDWKNEDDIRSELRVLTGELKRLREELRDMVSPPKTSKSRPFLHRQGWPTATTAPRTEMVATANDQKPAPRKRRARRKPHR